VSVFDKRGIADFAKKLKALGYEIISTEGTGKELAKNGITFIPAQKISKNPNKLRDCIKTISFRIEAGILFDRLDQKQVKETKELSIKPVDIVACNFPPIKKVVKKPEDFNIKNIDVGGPLIVRAAATNFRHVLVIVDPNDYKKVAEAILKKKITNEFRRQLAIKAFTYTYSYDEEIIQFLKRSKDFVK
jgi:phosphoribosylaminoimidazolecarboxamide formyltransferase/IMP cyclohydrolase